MQLAYQRSAGASRLTRCLCFAKNSEFKCMSRGAVSSRGKDEKFFFRPWLESSIDEDLLIYVEPLLQLNENKVLLN